MEEPYGVISVSSRMSGGVIRAGISQHEAGSVISMSFECNGLSSRDGTGEGFRGSAWGRRRSVLLKGVYANVRGGVAINDGVLFSRFQNVSWRFRTQTAKRW